MKKMYVSISNFEDVGRFVNIVDRMKGNVDLVCGRYIIDARSVVGVATLVGGRVLELCMHERQEKEIERQLEQFMCCAA